MNKSMLAGIGIGVAAALGVAAVASLNVFERGPQYAQVVSATPIKETVKTPRQECRNVTVTHRRPVQDENRITGSVLGAVAGGVIGHQFGGGRGKDVATVVGALGGGRGKDVATVVGALGGGYAGNQIQGSLQESDTYTTTQQRCKTVYDKSEKMLGYDVTYKIGDQQGKIRMDRDPGTQIPLDSNGQLILNNKV
ncbi:glycine zipper 2TM domain-containing protein [Escherichia coli]|nr:glycine zipper 2TM domain-containing protein [Escherichia coli]EHQ8508188.1 glycine zipper 2TM domain-containing protein [Escherichia coli]EHZ4657202.1 glycine zipper 2TM domain-containing protein [Escherichia coli]MHX65369.1 glycine zipper 2TM domain-containing protein [Escherichia coli]HDY1936432.1 glycine zipper 2TM domain-containing protein [Escherichia coli]